MIGHLFTLLWFGGMTYFLCHTLSGRAAYLHIGGMLGTWMAGNVFMRIIPRQVKMVEAAKRGEPVNQEWSKNAKNRSTHNTYITLPVIFIMMSNHFPTTYGHELNWIILFLLCGSGAALREYFVKRLGAPTRAKKFLVASFLLFFMAIFMGREVTAPAQSDLIVKALSEKEEPAQTVKIISETESPTFDIAGVVNFEGGVPRGSALKLPAACASQHKGDVYSNEVIVNNGKLQNVLIRVVKGHEGKIYQEIPAVPVELDQKGCIYEPRVTAARVGQEVIFINSDPIFHNVKSVTKENQRFNLSMPKKDQRQSKIFTKPELFLQAKCSVHPWMGAYIAIMDHPFYAITNAKGEFRISDLPQGEYTLEAWHEVYGTKELVISVDENKEINFIYKSEDKK